METWRERLTPDPQRGAVVAAGVAALTLAMVLFEARFSNEWAAAERLVPLLGALALVGALTVLARNREDVPRSWQAVLHVAAFVLAAVTLAALADALGSEGGSGTLVWTGLLLTAPAAWLGRARNSPVMTLLAALAAVTTFVAFVDWAIGFDSLQTLRWLLLLCALALAAGAAWWRDARRRHAVSLVDAAGVLMVLIGSTLVADAVLGGILGGDLRSDGGPAGWELVLLLAGAALVAYGAWDRERVPAFLGVVVLALFAVAAGAPSDDGPSLLAWPLLLLLAATALLAHGLRLRPRGRGPAEPAPAAPVGAARDEAPTEVA